MPIGEAIESRRFARDNGNSTAELVYNIWDETDAVVANNSIDSDSPTTVVVGGKTLVRYATRVEPGSTDSIWKGTASYAEKSKQRTVETPATGDSEFSFDISGEQFQLTYSKLQTKFGPNAPDMNKAINVDNNFQPQGVSIIVPAVKYGESHYLPLATVTLAYVDAVSKIVGTTNSGTFRGIGIDRLLLVSVSGAKRGTEDWRLNFGWALGTHVTGQTVAGISGVGKNAHDYLWVRYVTSKDATAKALRTVAQGVYVEKIYDSASYSPLEIGS